MRESTTGLPLVQIQRPTSVTNNVRKLTYQSAQRFVEAQFLATHNARIRCDYPTIMAVSDAEHKPLSVAGIRSPIQPFFLEHYLDSSAEQVLSEHFRIHIRREKIVEIGNLAGGRDRLATTYLMHQLWNYLIRCGFEYLMLTGTCSLLHRFRQLPFHHLTDARAGQVPQSSSWGNYYQQSPRVVAGRLADYDFRFYRSKKIDGYRFEVLTAGGER